MRLSSFIPTISAETVSHLEEYGIRTDSDLLFTPLFELYRRLPRNTLGLQDLAGLCTTVTGLSAAEAILGGDLLETELLGVGDGRIDELLRGLGGKRVIEISGDRGTGKSTLALNIALNHLLEHPNERVAWVDTLGDFSPAAACDILRSSMQVSLAFDTDTLHSVLDELFEYTAASDPPRILAIDAIAPLLGPILSGITSHGHALMTDLMLRLKTIANESRCTVLVINNATLKEPYDASKTNQERKPALGPTFTFMTDTTLWLSQKAPEIDEEAAEKTSHLRILKSRTKAAGAYLPYCVVQGRFQSSEPRTDDKGEELGDMPL
ncbi:P-loop containing nucleoside triphosphate hydrolase protein [Coprinellus micaceus]|uniref:P-loop containing nucleoside triphosphate hydrolase protein n=1 Tax=Coprinellus micaceus TaxID=71717 RepID=A0A4Y7STF8_COPMI|nr:P-loop containing nucleoside triphosphate hydrolase protein [Coprinellus micaceus]